MKTRSLCLALLLALVSAVVGQKPVLDHDVYDKWPAIRGSEMSPDGKWFLYTVGPAVGDAELTILNLQEGTTVKVPRGTNARFTYDSKFALATIVPSKEDADKARKDKKPAPKNSVVFVNLATQKVATVEFATTFRISEEDKGWIAFSPEKPAPAAPPTAAGEPKTQGAAQPAAGAAKADEPQKKKEHAVGKDLVLLHLGSGQRIEISDAVDYAFRKGGEFFAFTRSTKDGKADGVYSLDLTQGAKATARPIMTGLGYYRSLTISDQTGTVAFLTDRADYKAEQPVFQVFISRPGQAEAEMAASIGSAGLPDGWWVNPTSPLTFSESGNRLNFRTVLRPKVEPKKEEVPAEDQVSLDVWNWKDPELQPMQLLSAANERSRTYAAIYDLSSKKVIQLETPDLRGVSVGSRGDARFAVGVNNRPYRQLVSWDDTYADYYLIDLKSGDRQRILEKSPGNVSLSPGAQYAYWYDQDAKAWFALDTSSRERRNLSSKVPHALYDIEDDHPAAPPGLGAAGWTKNDEWFVVYDQFDLWALDPTGAKAPVNVTDGFGRSAGIRFRSIRLDRESDVLAPDLLLSAVDLRSKATGFYRDSIGAKGRPQKLVMEDRNLGLPTKATDADRLYFTKQSFNEYPDIWVSSLDFADAKKVTDANPLVRQYKWGTSELIEWTSLNGQKLRGILRKPEDFSPLKNYPMIVYFYENLTDTLHAFRGPGPSGGAGISPSFYTSRGYVVFEPDIPYQVGYPGQSAKDSILPGVASVIAKGYVDPKRVGMLGHSWGGYQTAYLATQSDMFRCAIAGAPVSNMISAYGGIRWGSGMVRAFQYEKGQSRIGGSLWEKPLQFIENSPIFWVEKVRTPLLLLHNDQDDAVPWYQSIELFTALRRLGKPTWFINYNGEFHGIRKRANQKDWSVRMQQFFDHYLKDAPAPKWLVDGIPATEKGREFGLDPAKSGG